jgi:hypothetical protein
MQFSYNTANFQYPWRCFLPITTTYREQRNPTFQSGRIGNNQEFQTIPPRKARRCDWPDQCPFSVVYANLANASNGYAL